MSWPRFDRIGSRGLGRVCSKSGARHCIIVRRRVAFVDKLRRYPLTGPLPSKRLEDVHAIVG